jgi:hypothetical protein
VTGRSLPEILQSKTKPSAYPSLHQFPKRNHDAEPGSRANDHTCHGLCLRTARAMYGRGSLVTLGRFEPLFRDAWEQMKRHDQIHTPNKHCGLSRPVFSPVVDASFCPRFVPMKAQRADQLHEPTPTNPTFPQTTSPLSSVPQLARMIPGEQSPH